MSRDPRFRSLVQQVALRRKIRLSKADFLSFERGLDLIFSGFRLKLFLLKSVFDPLHLADVLLFIRRDIFLANDSLGFEVSLLQVIVLRK